MASKSWYKKEWKEKRKERVENGSCAICGGTQNLVIHHTNETITKNYPIEKKVIRELINIKANAGEIPFDGRFKDGGYWLGDQGYKEFSVKYRSEIVEEARKHPGYVIAPDYCDLNKETIILCNACHLALHKGMILCKECGKLRHMIEDTKCRECRWRDKSVTIFFGILDRVVNDPSFATTFELKVLGDKDGLAHIWKEEELRMWKMAKLQA